MSAKFFCHLSKSAPSLILALAAGLLVACPLSAADKKEGPAQQPNDEAKKAPPAKEEGKKPEEAKKPVVLLEADQKKTTRVKVGSELEIRLIGDLPGVGWYSQPIVGEGVARIGEKPGERCRLADFAATPNATNESQGTYHFRYETLCAGKAELKFVYFKPGGPNPFGYPAFATVRVREITLKIEVEEEPKKTTRRRRA